MAIVNNIVQRQVYSTKLSAYVALLKISRDLLLLFKAKYTLTAVKGMLSDRVLSIVLFKQKLIVSLYESRIF